MYNIKFMVNDSLYREVLAQKVRSNISGQTKADHKVVFVQASRYNKAKFLKGKFDLFIMLGTLECFHYWIDVKQQNKTTYITPNDSINGLCKSFNILCSEEYFISNSIKNLIDMSDLGRQNRILDTYIPQKLTFSELKIMYLIGKGCSSKNISQLWCRSIHTVKTHKRNIRRKLKNCESNLNFFIGRNYEAIKTLYQIKKHNEFLKECCKIPL